MICALDGTPYAVGKLDQNGVANLVAVALIDKAEMLYIDVKQRAGAGTPEPDLTIFNERLFV